MLDAPREDARRGEEKHDAEQAADFPAATLRHPGTADPAGQAVQKVRRANAMRACPSPFPCSPHARERVNERVIKVERPANGESFIATVDFPIADLFARDFSFISRATAGHYLQQSPVDIQENGESTRERCVN